MNSLTVKPTVTVQVFDPAMCCSTGVCGPGVDTALIQVAADLEWLKGQGVTVERYGLSQQAGEFAKNARVLGLMQAFGDKALPAVLVNDEVLAYGHYPTRDEIAAAVKDAAQRPAQVASAAGCVPGSGCCGG